MADAKAPQGKYAKETETRRAPIDDSKKEEMLAVLIRNPDAFDTVHELFQVAHCKAALGETLALVWREVRQFFKKYAELPGKTQLESCINDAIAANPALLPEGEEETVEKFLQFAWDDAEHGRNLAKSGNARRVAVDTCKEVLEELETATLHTSLDKDGTRPADMLAVLTASQQRLDQIQSLSGVDLDVPFPDGWDRRSETQLVTTGVPALDAFMGGGWRAGECLLFMAPYGSCKTSLTCFSTAQLVKLCGQRVADGTVRRDKKGRPMTPVVVLAFTESDKNEYRDRLMSNLAQVPWKRLMTMEGIASLDAGTKPARGGARDAPTQYELKEFADKVKDDPKHKTWLNEQQRVRGAVRLANKHLLLVDCTDADDSPYRIGSGGMAEVANVIRGVFRRRKDIYPVAVWVDHLSGLADRMSDVIQDETQLRRTLTNMPRVAVEKIAKPLECPIGVMHQFSGASQNKGVTAKLHHSEGEGSKSIGKYVNFAVVSGPVDANMMCLWEATKHRREPPTATRIVRVDGDFSRLVDCTATHGVEPGRRVIMTKDEMRTASVLANANGAGNFDNPQGM